MDTMHYEAKICKMSS